MSPILRLLPLWIGTLALGGCFGSYERAVEETRAGLIGKTGRELRGCLGVPTDFDRDGEVELLTYRWFSNPKLKNGGPVTGGIVIGQGGISAAAIPAVSRAGPKSRRSASSSSRWATTASRR